MTTGPRPVTDLLLAVAGPIIWAAHFFGVYLSEALLCSSQAASPQWTIRSVGVVLTVVAFAALGAFAMLHRPSSQNPGRSAEFPFAFPLVLLSILGVIWTALPLFLLPVCTPGGS